MEVGLGPYPQAGPDALAIYRELGYVVGDRLFAVVGRFVYLPGPADSTYAIFALSLPNNALRFRREPPDFSPDIKST